MGVLMRRFWRLAVQMICFLIFGLSAFATLTAQQRSVVVIGGGPTGLGAAIEAKLAGFQTTLVEKRGGYSRQNTLFLFTSTLELIEEWNAPISFLEELEFKGQRRAFVLIKDLEMGLASFAENLGVQRVLGECIGFSREKRAVYIQTEEGQKNLSYDILVGADGTHSRVREMAGIANEILGEGAGGVSMVFAQNPKNQIIVEIQSHPEVFAKKVYVPNATVLFFQNQPQTPFHPLDLERMIDLCSEIGWQKEADCLANGSLFAMENISIPLQRSATFSDPERSLILLGDAAASASFYMGAGVNFSFKTIRFAKEFFKDWPQISAYERFNRDMEEQASWLIDLSRPLY